MGCMKRKAYWMMSLFLGMVSVGWSVEALHWEWSGWGGGGWFWCTAFDAKDPDTLYMGGDVIGIYKSEDCGASWRLVNRGLHNYAVYSMTASPRESGVVYAMTVDGMVRSTDGGEGWTVLSETRRGKRNISARRSGTVQAIALDSTVEGRVIAGSGEGRVFVSEDAGETWRELPYREQVQGKGPIATVLISEADPRQVFVAQTKQGLYRSRDGGETWEVVGAGTLPQGVTHIVGGLAKAPNRYYACFGREGVYASTDGGEHWEHKPGDFPAGMPMRMLAMDPRNPLTVHLIAKSGHYVTYDGGDSWLPCRLYERDYVYNPTLPEEPWGRRKSGLVTEASGIALSPVNPDHILIAANWNNVVSRDGGISWVESAKGADISCIHDVRFAGDSVYAVAMDEGLLRSDDNGATWKALYPKRWAAGVSGHQWRVLPQVLADGSVRIVSTLSAWKHGSAEFPNAVLISRDGGHSFEKTTAGLPSRRPKHHTMWEEGYARALCADPSHLDTLYLGIDGKASPEDPQSVDGGIFKSTNGGKMWKRLPQQPESLQSFYGLAVDPTDSKRIFWGTCGEKSGVYRSLDGGESWQKTSLSDGIFSLEIMPSGTILAGGKFLWMSRDHGETWTQASTLKNVTVCGLAFDPENEQRLWIAGNRWGTSAGEGVWESTDGGTTWRDITADLPNTRPNNLRYNPRTRELWAVGPAAFRIQR